MKIRFFKICTPFKFFSYNFNFMHFAVPVSLQLKQVFKTPFRKLWVQILP